MAFHDLKTIKLGSIAPDVRNSELTVFLAACCRLSPHLVVVKLAYTPRIAFERSLIAVPLRRGYGLSLAAWTSCAMHGCAGRDACCCRCRCQRHCPALAWRPLAPRCKRSLLRAEQHLSPCQPQLVPTHLAGPQCLCLVRPGCPLALQYNKGLAFSQLERDRLYLRGLLPPAVLSQEVQAERVLTNIRRWEAL